MKQKVEKVRIVNFKKIAHADITVPADDHVIYVCGGNRAGKSSLLDALASLIGGAKLFPEEPIRDGAKSGAVEAVIGDYVVRREFAAGRSPTLKITCNGERQPSPQGFLTALVGGKGFALDPSMFERLSPDKQAELIKDVAGLDLSDLDERRAGLYAERTQTNRDRKRLESALAELDTPPEDTPDEEVDIADLVDRLNQAAELARDRERVARDIEGRRIRIGQIKQQIANLERDIAALETANEAAEARLAEMVEPEDGEALQAQLAAAESINAAVRLKMRRQEMERDIADLADHVDMLTREIEKTDIEKRNRLTSASFPVDGLGVDDDSGMVTFRGRALRDISGSELFELSLGIALATQPADGLGLVLMHHGEALDDDRLAIVERLAEQYDAQVFVERVGVNGPVTYVVTDGQVEAVAVDKEAEQ